MVPPPAVITANGPTTFCAGDSVVLTSSAPFGIIWQPTLEQTQSITVFASNTYVVKRTNIFGCSSTPRR